jgi:hypothetical protein
MCAQQVGFVFNPNIVASEGANAYAPKSIPAGGYRRLGLRPTSNPISSGTNLDPNTLGLWFEKNCMQIIAQGDDTNAPLSRPAGSTEEKPAGSQNFVAEGML